MAGEVVVRQARPSDTRAIAEVSVASRRWSYHDVLPEADLDALSVEKASADFAEGLTELPPGSAVYVAELASRIVGYAYVLPSPDDNVPAGTYELGSLYVTEDVAGTDVAPALMDAAIEHAHANDKASSRSGFAERTAGLVASTRSTACGQTVQSAAVPRTSCRPR